MPQIKSQIKRMRTNEIKRQRNCQVKSEIHTYIKKFRDAANAGETETAIDQYNSAVKKLDKAASKGVIHKNKAANQKSKLAKQVKSLSP